MKKRLNKISKYFILSTVAALWIVPFIYILFNSLKSQKDFYLYGIFSFPRTFALENYVETWEIIRPYYGNSLIVLLITVPVVVFLSSLAAYPLARFNFRFRNIFAIVFLLGFMIPVQATILPIYNLFRSMDLLNSLIPLIFTYTAFNLSFTIYLMRGYFLSIPKEIEESAKIDGCSSWSIYLRIILPLSKPVIATAIVLNSLMVWNELFLALTLVQDNSKMTLPLGLLSFINSFAQSYNYQAAGMILATVPILVIYLFFQRYLIKAMAEGALKG